MADRLARVKNAFTTTGVDSRTITFDEGTALDSTYLLVAIVGADVSSTLTPAAGWTELTSVGGANTGISPIAGIRVYVRQGNSSINAFQCSGLGTGAASLQLLAFSGYSSLTPQAILTGNFASSTTWSFTEPSPVVEYGVLLHIGAAGASITSATFDNGATKNGTTVGNQRLSSARFEYAYGIGDLSTVLTIALARAGRYSTFVMPLLPDIANSTAAGDGSATGSFTPTLNGTAAGSGGATGSLTPSVSSTASGSNAASAVFIPTLTPNTGGSGGRSGSFTPTLSGVSSGAGTASGTLGNSLNGTASGGGSASGSLTVSVNGSASGSSTPAGVFRPVLSGLSSGAGGSSGTLVEAAVITGSASGSGGASATLQPTLTSASSGSGSSGAILQPILGGVASGFSIGNGSITISIDGVATGLGSTQGTYVVEVNSTASGNGNSSGAMTGDAEVTPVSFFVEGPYPLPFGVEGPSPLTFSIEGPLP